MNDIVAAERPSPRGAILGGIMCLFALGAAVVSFLSVSMMGERGSGSWFAGVAIEAGLGAVWLLWSGVKLVRRTPWVTFRLPGNLALAAGAVGIFVNLPYSFSESPAVEIEIARSLCILGAVALVAGLGHRAAAKKSPFAPMLHSLAVLGPLTVVALLAFAYASNHRH